MSESVWIAIIGGVVTIVLAWMNLRLGKIAKVADQTHTLVNSAMGYQLQLNAVSTRRLAILTNSPVDVQAAALAERALKEHEDRQEIVDNEKFPLG